jgi:hypothetical protein
MRMLNLWQMLYANGSSEAGEVLQHSCCKSSKSTLNSESTIDCIHNKNTFFLLSLSQKVRDSWSHHIHVAMTMIMVIWSQFPVQNKELFSLLGAWWKQRKAKVKFPYIRKHKLPGNNMMFEASTVRSFIWHHFAITNQKLTWWHQQLPVWYLLQNTMSLQIINDL